MKRLLPVATLFLLSIAPAPGVAASATEGLSLDQRGEAMVFRVDRPDAASVRVHVFDDASGTVLFDSGWSPAGPVEWRPSTEVVRPWRYRVEVRDGRGALVLSHIGIRDVGPLRATPQASSHGPSVMHVGSAQSTGSLRTFLEGSTAAVTQLGSISGGGQLRLLDEDGFTTARIDPDSDGTGVFFRLFRDQGQAGLIFDGNTDGSGEPLMAITGSTRSVVFDMSAFSGPTSVQLPDGSIEATEIFNESGGASSNATSQAGAGTVLSKTIAAPSVGYVLAIGTVEMTIGHQGGTDDHFQLGVSLDGTTIPAGQAFDTFVDADLPTAFFQRVVTVHGLFPVDPGLRTFRLILDISSAGGVIAAEERQLSLVYLPTTYGGVAAISSGPAAAAEQPVAGSSESEEVLDLVATEELIREGLEGELRTMEERLERLEQLLEHQGSDPRP